VTLKGEAPEEETSTEEGFELATDYPSLQASPGDQVSFNVKIHNKAGDERIVDLSAIPGIRYRSTLRSTTRRAMSGSSTSARSPRSAGGSASSPATRASRSPRSRSLETDKIAGNGSETVRVQVTPPMTASGEVPITFVARTDSVEEKLDLRVTVLGTPDLNLGTEAEISGTGETRNIRATEGRERTYTFYLWNEGTAPLHDLRLFASKPQDWEVTVDPEEHDRIDIRVSVGSSMKWGWVGVGVVLIVVAGLVGIFVRLGRR